MLLDPLEGGAVESVSSIFAAGAGTASVHGRSGSLGARGSVARAYHRAGSRRISGSRWSDLRWSPLHETADDRAHAALLCFRRGVPRVNAELSDALPVVERSARGSPRACPRRPRGPSLRRARDGPATARSGPRHRRGALPRSPRARVDRRARRARRLFQEVIANATWDGSLPTAEAMARELWSDISAATTRKTGMCAYHVVHGRGEARRARKRTRGRCSMGPSICAPASRESAHCAPVGAAAWRRDVPVSASPRAVVEAAARIVAEVHAVALRRCWR